MRDLNGLTLPSVEPDRVTGNLLRGITVLALLRTLLFSTGLAMLLTGASTPVLSTLIKQPALAVAGVIAVFSCFVASLAIHG